jgi:hypothetical protein
MIEKAIKIADKKTFESAVEQAINSNSLAKIYPFLFQLLIANDNFNFMKFVLNRWPKFKELIHLPLTNKISALEYAAEKSPKIFELLEKGD